MSRRKRRHKEKGKKPNSETPTKKQRMRRNFTSADFGQIRSRSSFFGLKQVKGFVFRFPFTYFLFWFRQTVAR